MLQVRNDSAGDFLLLLKEWDILCKRYVSNNGLNPENSTRETSESSSSTDDDSEPEEYEVEKLVDICYGDPDKSGESGLKFKVWQEDVCYNFVVDRLYSLVFTGLRMFFFTFYNL